MQNVSYSLTLQVPGGPQLPIAGTLHVDAYEYLKVAVPAAGAGGPGSAAVTVAPGTLASVRVLIITANVYDGSVRFQTSAGPAPVALDAPVTLIGAAAVGMLGSPPDTITLTNTGAAAAAVEILVGRNAVA